MLSCRLSGHPDVVIKISTHVDDFAGKMWVGAPFVDGKIMRARPPGRDTIGRVLGLVDLPWHWQPYTPAGFGRLIQLIGKDVSDARSGDAVQTLCS